MQIYGGLQTSRYTDFVAIDLFNMKIKNFLFVSELCHAATKIQASFRGHMIRKQMEKGEDGGANENPDGSKKPDNVSL